MRNIWKATGATLALLVSVTAEAQGYPQPPPRGYREAYGFRHNGLYLNGELGPAYLSSTFSVPGYSDQTASGPALFGSIAMGGSIAPNLILAADLFGVVAANPTVNYGGTNYDYSVSLAGLGPELVYYFEPSNMFISATLAFTRLTESSGNVDYASSNVGLGGRIVIAKEWWLGPRFGLGLGGQVFLSSNGEPSDVGTQRISTWGAGMLMSVTLN
jgi:hypothetical protein